MLTYLVIGSLLYLFLLLNLPLLPNNSSGITHLKAIRGLLLMPIIGVLLYLAVFRSLSVGTDYSMYHNFYMRGDYAQQFDFFIVLIYDFARSEGNFLLFTFIITGLFVIFNLVAIKKITHNFFVSFTFFILSFYFFYIFNGMRQAVAISIIFLAVYFIQKEKQELKDFMAYFLLIVLAAQFHISALFMLPLILLGFVKVNKPIVLAAFLVTVIGYFTPYLKSVLEEFLFVFDYYAQKYENDPNSFFTVSKEKNLLEFLPVLFQYVFLYYSLTLKTPKSSYEKFLVSYYLVFLFLYFASGVEATDRLQYYFYPSVILFYDYLIHTIYSERDHKKLGQLLPVSKMIALASISFWFLYFVVRVIQGTGGINPYNFMS